MYPRPYHKKKVVREKHTDPSIQIRVYCNSLLSHMIVLRCILFLIFATSAFRNSSATLIAVTTSLLAVATLTRVFTGRVYKNWYIDILEGVFILNLGILSVATSHNMMTGGNQQLVADLSGGTSLILFLLIVAYHVANSVPLAYLKQGGPPCLNLD